MDQNLKNRLVGVIVIFALVVIFLPMVLDGSGVRRAQREVVIPPQPLVPANPEFEEKIVELKTRVEALPELEARYVDEKSPPRQDAAEEPGQAGADAGAPVASSPAAARQEVAAVAATADEAAAPARPGGESWVLQVGSFQDRSKALAQRDRLRQSNVAAVFIEQFSNNGKSSYRVRLGPFLSREQGRVAQNKIKAKHDIDGIIMKYER